MSGAPSSSSDGSDTVKVAVRCRDLNLAEIDSGAGMAIEVHPVSEA